MSATTSFPSSPAQDQQRFEAPLPFTLSICGNEADEELQQQSVTLIGYTSSVGDDALSLVGPLHQFGYRYLMGRDRTLQIELDLPTGPVSLQGIAARYITLRDEITEGYMLTGPGLEAFSGTDVNCLIEVSIMVMSEDNRAQFKEYLRQLAQADAPRTSAQDEPLTLSTQVLAA